MEPYNNSLKKKRDGRLRESGGRRRAPARRPGPGGGAPGGRRRWRRRADAAAGRRAAGTAATPATPRSARWPWHCNVERSVRYSIKGHEMNSPSSTRLRLVSPDFFADLAPPQVAYEEAQHEIGVQKRIGFRSFRRQHRLLHPSRIATNSYHLFTRSTVILTIF